MSAAAGQPIAAAPRPRRIRRGHSTLEVSVAAALLALQASGLLGAANRVQGEATLSSMRQTAIALAGDRLEWLTTGGGEPEAVWQERVATVLPGGQGLVRVDATGAHIEVRWRAPGTDDTRCPGTVCVVLGRGA